MWYGIQKDTNNAVEEWFVRINFLLYNIPRMFKLHTGCDSIHLENFVKMRKCY